MSEPLQNIESPLFFSTLGNLTSAEALAELNRLKSQQTQVRSEINRVKNEKESNGAKLIRCKSSLKNDCGELEYQLNQFVDQYYRLQGQDDGLTKEIARLQEITTSTVKVADTPFLNAEVDCEEGKHLVNGVCVDNFYLGSKVPLMQLVALIFENPFKTALVVGLLGWGLYTILKTKKS